MKHKTILCIAVLLLCGLPLSAQKKQISQARTYIKSGKDFDKAEKLMTDLLKDTANRQNIKIYDIWFDAVKGQYEAANEKLYLKQKYDTASFYNLIRRLQQVAISLDSLNMKPDKKGRVNPSYRKSHAEMLNSLRPNIYYGGTWHLRKNNFSSAFDFFDTYLDAARQPLFTDYRYEQTDAQLPQAAYWATYCGFKMQDADRILKYCKQAQNDPSKAAYGMQYEAVAYQLRKDVPAYVETLRRGFEHFPLHPYFFPRLADYYAGKNQFDSVLVVANKGLEVSQSNSLFLMAKSVALLNLEQYDECIATSNQLIEVNDSLPEPYLNIATCYLNQALVVEQENEPRKNRQKLQSLYQSARPFMENYRRMASADQQRWAPALYRIYFNLNLGKQFEEIDKLMRK